MPPFEEVEHTADRAFRARGRDLAELFTHAAQAMMAIQDANAAGDRITREVEITGVDRETLLVNWLNEILYLQEKHGEVYDQFDIMELSGERLRARLLGGPRKSARALIKAATFHDLQVRQTAGGWEATVVVDV